MELGSEHASIVDRALTILEELARSGAALSFTDLCARTSTPKATMHRLLATPQSRGYVTQDGFGQYSAGVRCFELGSMWRRRKLDVRAVAGPYLGRLNEESQETVHLGVDEHGDVIYIDRIESPQQVIAKSYVGRRCTAASVATGRVLLAYSDLAEIERVLREPIPAYTEHSIVDPAAMRELLAQVRTNGLAQNRCSYRSEVSGIAAPIRDHTGRVVASVGLCMPDHRFRDDRLEALPDLTLQAVGVISVALGGPAGVVTAGRVSAAADKS